MILDKCFDENIRTRILVSLLISLGKKNSTRVGLVGLHL